MTDIAVRNNEDAGRFEAELEGETAFAEYRLLENGDVLFPHTVVPEAFEGRGVGSALARAGLDWARAKGVRVVPACSFFRGYIDRHPEYADLVRAGGR